MGDILEIQFKYNGHLVIFFYNFKDLKAFKASIDFQTFYEIFGCNLSINSKKIDNGTLITSNTIYLSVCDKDDFNKENFHVGLYRIMLLLGIDKDIRREILINIMNTIPKSDKKLMYHNVVIMNDDSQQRIEFYHLIVSKSKTKEYKYMLQNNNIL